MSSRNAVHKQPKAADQAPRGVSGPTSATANAVLGLLTFGQELSGYEVKKWADHSLSAFFFSPATSQIYAELHRLEDLGFVSSRIEAVDDVRLRRRYTITEAGQAWLSEWLATDPAGVPVLKNATLLRVWLGHQMDSDALRVVVTEHRDWLVQRLDQVRTDLAAVPEAATMAYANLVIRWAERRYAAELDNAEQLLDDLDGLESSGN